MDSFVVNDVLYWVDWSEEEDGIVIDRISMTKDGPDIQHELSDSTMELLGHEVLSYCEDYGLVDDRDEDA